MTGFDRGQQIGGATTRPFRLALVALAVLLAGVASCDDEPTTTTDTTTPITGDPIRLTFDFESGSDGWASDVSDFSEETRPEDVLSETGRTPPDVDDESGYFHVAASNRSDDMFLFIKRLIGEQADLVPDLPYAVEYTVSAASNAPSDCAGIGGAPGESVWLKVGASTEQPVPLHEDGYTRLSVDKGTQSEGGDDAVVAGVVANGIPCEEALEADQPYAMVTWEAALDSVETDEDGNMWLFVGVDSGFEGRTSLYYDRVEVVLTPQS